MADDRNDNLDLTATGQGEPPKDEAGVTGGEYADSDPNPAFHGQEEAPGDAEDLPVHTAYEEDTPGTPGHVTP